jgi:hypothetical protein
MLCNGSGELATDYSVRYVGRGNSRRMIAEKTCSKCGLTIGTYGASDSLPRLRYHDTRDGAYRKGTD